MTHSILTRVAGGDHAAVQDCINRYGGIIWSMAQRMSPSHSEAEDAVQEIFIELWKHAARFDATKSSEPTFVTMIAKRRLIDRLRSQQRRPLEADLEFSNDTPAPHPLCQEQSADVAKVQKLLSELKPEQRRILKLSIHLGLSHTEIATLTETAIGTVKSHIRRGIHHLRERLQQGDSRATGRVSS